jgi:hypothetical protein
MQKLLDHFKDYTLEDIIRAEESDSQFQVLKHNFPDIDTNAFVA